MFIVAIAAITILVADLSLVKIYGIGLNLYMSSIPAKILIFIVLTLSGLLCQYVIIQYIKNKTTNSKISITLHLQVLHRVFSIFQYSLAGISVFVVLQIIIENYYSTILLIAITSFSYILALVMLGILTIRFFSWFKLYRNSVTLSYGLTSVMLAINAHLFTLTRYS